MYGYVVVNKPELKIRELEEYRSYYCGLCRALGEDYSGVCRMSLSYDMTFLIMLLNGLYEPEITEKKTRCVIHPVASHIERKSVVTDYVADMTVLLSYYHCMDDWEDDRKLSSRLYGDILKKHISDIELRYPDKTATVKSEITRLSELEGDSETNIDTVSECFGNIMAAVVTMKEDEWQEDLRQLGRALGRFVYIMDAYDDLETDIKKGRYNVLKYHRDTPGFEEFIRAVLNETMAECAMAFERLPVIQGVEILRNIIYSGVWTRYEAIQRKK